MEGDPPVPDVDAAFPVGIGRLNQNPRFTAEPACDTVVGIVGHVTAALRGRQTQKTAFIPVQTVLRGVQDEMNGLVRIVAGAAVQKIQTVGMADLRIADPLGEICAGRS